MVLFSEFTQVVVNINTTESMTCQISSFANLLLIVSLIKKLLIIMFITSNNCSAIKYGLSGVNRGLEGKNQSTSVNLSAAVHQIEKWIAYCTVNLHYDKKTNSFNTCLINGNGHRYWLAPGSLCLSNSHPVSE